MQFFDIVNILLVFLLVILLDSLLLLDSTVGAQEVSIFPLNSPSKFCSRSLSTTVGERTFDVRAALPCDDTSGRLITYGWSLAAGFPVTSMRVFERNSEIGSGRFTSFFALDTAIHYLESNGVPGFQPKNDTIVNRFSMRDSLTTLSADLSLWNNFDLNRYSLTSKNDTFLIRVKTNTKRPITGLCDRVIHSVFLTPTELLFQQDGLDSPNAILSPNSFKYVVSMRGVAKNDASTNLALGGLLITRKEVRFGNMSSTTTTPSSTPQSAEDSLPTSTTTIATRPNEQSLGENIVVSIPTEVTGDAKPNGGYFSWKPYAMAWKSSGSSSKQKVSVLASVGEVEVGMNLPAEYTSGFTIKRIWFSIALGEYDNFDWDPSIAAEENEAPKNVVGNASVVQAQTITLFLFLFGLLFWI